MTATIIPFPKSRAHEAHRLMSLMLEARERFDGPAAGECAIRIVALQERFTDADRRHFNRMEEMRETLPQLEPEAAKLAEMVLSRAQSMGKDCTIESATRAVARALRDSL